MRQRPPRSDWRRVQEMTRLQRTGGARENVAAAAPVPAATRAIAAALGSTATNTGGAFYAEAFTLAGGVESVDLTYLPITESERVFLNGLELGESGPFWTRSRQTLTLDAAAEALAGDKLVVKYAYLSGMPVAPAPASTADFLALVRTTGTDSAASTVNLPTGLTSGMFVMAFTSGDRYNTPATPPGWTFRGHVLNWWSNLYVYTKPITGTEGSSVTFAMGSAGNTFYAITAAYDATTVQNVALSAAGTDAGGGPSGTDFTQPSVNVTSLAARVVHCTSGAKGTTGMSGFTMGTDVAIRDQFPFSATAEISIGDFAATATGTSPTEVAHGDADAWSGITLAIS